MSLICQQNGIKLTVDLTRANASGQSENLGGEKLITQIELDLLRKGVVLQAMDLPHQFCRTFAVEEEGQRTEPMFSVQHQKNERLHRI